MSLRDQVMISAMVGGAPALEPEGSALDPLLGMLAQRAIPQRTLDAIALVTAYTEAGLSPLPAAQLPVPCADDSRHICGPSSAGHCRELLTDRRGLLREWLALLNATNLRAPEEFLPGLLDAATGDRTLRKDASAAAGPRGPWLAQFRPEWLWTRAGAADESAWETGTQAERAAFLEQLRQSDPARARGLVESTWAEESAEGRRQFVEALTVCLEPEDEAFLEKTLDDRSVAVRRAAAELLGSLPDSQLSQRMAQRLAGRIRLEKTGLLGRKRVIEVVPFEEIDAAMVRDGIEKKPPAGLTVGERAWWTEQAMACIHPSHWVRSLEVTEPQLVEAAKNGEWAALLLEGWRRAAIRHRAQEWFSTLAEQAVPGISATVELFRGMQPEPRETAMASWLDKEPKAWLPQVAICCDHPWSLPFTRTVLKATARNLPAGPTDPFGYQMKPLLRASALLASTDLTASPEGDDFAEFTDILSFRRRMRQALQNQENR